MKSATSKRLLKKGSLKKAKKAKRANAKDKSIKGKLRKMKPKSKRVQIVGFDTEDYEGTPVSFAFYDGIEPFYTKSDLEALNYIYNYKSDLPVCFVCHNLQYDIANLCKGTDYNFVKKMIFASKLLSVQLEYVNHKDLFFMDSSAYFSGTLASMGAMMGIPKLEGSAFNKEYNIQDSKIVYEFMNKLQNRLLDDGLSLALTISSMTMNDYLTNFFMGKSITTHNSKLSLAAYYGGRVEIFYKGFCKEPVNYADINSSYPNVMLREEYPHTGSIEESTLATHLFGVGHFKIHVPDTCFIPPLPFHSSQGRLYFPTGDIEGTWTYAEIRFALSKGCTILEEYVGEGTNISCRPFTDFIHANYTSRKEAKERKEKKELKGETTFDEAFEDLYFKLKMNSLYGKFSQHKDKVEMTRDKKTPEQCVKLGIYSESRVGPFYQYKIKRVEAPKNANYLWGTYITSYARINLMKALYAVHEAGGKLLYCDTDSVLFTGTEAAKSLPCSNDLGDMKIKVYDAAFFKMAKGYILCKDNLDGSYTAIDMACKGVPTSQAFVYLKGETATFMKPNKLKQALIRKSAEVNKNRESAFMREMEENVWLEIKKSARSIYYKRKGDNGITLPVNILEIDELEGRDWSEKAKEQGFGVEIKAPPSAKAHFKTEKQLPGWKKAWFKKDEDIVKEIYERKGTPYLNKQRCLELEPGDSFVSGKVMALENTKYGSIYRVRLTTYGKYKAAKMAPIAVPTYYFMPEIFKEINFPFNFVGKNIELFLVKKYLANYHDEIYIDNTPLYLSGKVFE